jgi:hypothetical protein
MLREKIMRKLSFTLLLVCWIISTPASAGDLGLVDLLTSQLGVTKGQAAGGAGSIFRLAKENLGAKDFGTIAKAVPGIGGMMDAAPKAEKSSSVLGSVSSMLGGGSSKLGKTAALADSFKKLGLGGDMVDKFVPIVIDYVKEKGGKVAMDLLKSAL